MRFVFLTASMQSWPDGKKHCSWTPKQYWATEGSGDGQVSPLQIIVRLIEESLYVYFMAAPLINRAMLNVFKRKLSFSTYCGHPDPPFSPLIEVLSSSLYFQSTCVWITSVKMYLTRFKDTRAYCPVFHTKAVVVTAEDWIKNKSTCYLFVWAFKLGLTSNVNIWLPASPFWVMPWISPMYFPGKSEV